MERLVLEKISIDEFLELTKKDEISISREEAEEILGFLYYLAGLVILEHFEVEVLIN